MGKTLKKIIVKNVSWILLIALNVVIIQPAYAKIVFENEFLLENTGANAWVIDSLDDATGDLILQFGNALAESLTWDSANTLFQISDDFYIENTLGIGALPAVSKDLYIQSLLPTVLLSDTNPTTGNRLRFDIIGATSWFSQSWSNRKKVTIDNTQVSGSSDLTDFPVLYSVGADADLAAGAQADGDDIVFTASDGITKLSHEIESYDSGTGTLYAWVKVPTLSATLNTEIFMYYGNAGAVNQQDPTNVWNSNYAAVYHLEEDVVDEATSVAAHTDSTSNNNDLTQNGNVETASQIYFGQAFDGTDDYAKATGSNSYRISGNITLETWLYRNNSATQDDLIDSQGPVGSELEDSNHLYEFWIGADNALRLEWEYGAGFNETTLSSVPVATANQNWVYLVATRDIATNEVKFYENGVQLGTTQSYTNDPTGGTINDLDLGRQAGAGSDYLDGNLDEVRISNVTKSDAWIQTSYNNMNAPGTFASAGGEEIFTSGKGMIGSVNAIPFNLLTDDTERITITGTGEVGIGTTTPASALDIEKTGEVIEIGNATATDSFINFDDGTDRNFGWDDSASAFFLSENVNTFGTILTLDADNTGVGANVDIVANQGSDTDGTLRYNATDNLWQISNNGGTFFDIQQAEVFYAYDAIGTQAINATEITVNIDTTVISDGIYSLSADEVTVSDAGLYKITGKVGTDDINTAGGARATSEIRLQNNAVDIAGAVNWCYHRETTSNTCELSIVTTLSAADVIRLRTVRIDGTTNMATRADGSSLMIERIR